MGARIDDGVYPKSGFWFSVNEERLKHAIGYPISISDLEKMVYGFRKFPHENNRGRVLISLCEGLIHFFECSGTVGQCPKKPKNEYAVMTYTEEKRHFYRG